MPKRTKWFLILILVVFILIVLTVLSPWNKVGANECWKDCQPTPTIHLCFTGDEEIPHPCPTLTITPTAGVSATASPSAFIFPGPTEGSGGYFNDNLGCGTHSCIGKPSYILIPTSAPNTGRAE